MDERGVTAGEQSGGGVAVHEQPRRTVDQPLPQMPVRSGGARAAKTRRGAEKAGRKAGMPVKAISASVPAGLAAAWKERARRDGVTQVDVVLHAVAEQREQLADLVAEHQRKQRPTVATASNGLFVQRVEATAEEPYVTVSLRMLGANVDVLDGLAHEAGAPSRSALMAAALGAWLQG